MQVRKEWPKICEEEIQENLVSINQERGKKKFKEGIVPSGTDTK